MNTKSRTTSTRIMQATKRVLDFGKKSPQDRANEWAWIKREYTKEYRQMRRKVRINPERYVLLAAGLGLLLGASLRNKKGASKE